MKLKKIDPTNYAVVLTQGAKIKTEEDALELLGEAYYQGYDKIILSKEYLTPDFFNLKSGLAGEILQKFSNYGMRLAIIGDFSVYKSENLQDFIRESNRGQLINFLDSIEEALKR